MPVKLGSLSGLMYECLVAVKKRRHISVKWLPPAYSFMMLVEQDSCHRSMGMDRKGLDSLTDTFDFVSSFVMKIKCMLNMGSH